MSFIKINPERTDNYTNPTLKKFFQGNEGAAVIVRDLEGRTSEKVQNASLSQTSGTARICQLLEQGLLKNGFNVRDRQLFEAVADKTDKNLDYAELHKKTEVDAIFEVTSFNWDKYEVNNYYEDGVQKSFDPKFNERVYDLYGFSIEIKVIMLQNNIVGGTYKYFYTPCDSDLGGCLLTKIEDNSITYIPLETSKPEVLGNASSSFLGKIKGEDKKKQEYVATRTQSNEEKFEKAVSKFITDTVIPGIVSDIKGKK
ncbi:hypothetical protein AGMMS49525_09590 [Bacteroidia bacterium]|nr:hypothetical protein AGMMS49525_09590 [Bacteroidia bacterium]